MTPQPNGTFHEEVGALEQVSLFFLSYFRGAGMFWLRFWKLSIHPLTVFYTKVLKAPLHRLDLFLLRVRKWGSRRYKGFLFCFYHFIKFYIDAWTVIRTGYQEKREKGLPAALLGAFAAFFRGVCNNAGFFLKALNYLLPAAALTAFLFLVFFVKGQNYAVGVEYNGEMIGYVEDESVYTEAQTRLQSRMIYQEGDPVQYATPKFTLSVLQQQDYQSVESLTDNIVKSSSADIVQATGISVDGTFLGAVQDSASLHSALSQLLESHRKSSDERVEFTKKVELQSGLYLQANLRKSTDIISTLTSNVQQNVYYTAVSGDTPSGIAEKYDMGVDELVSLNPSIITDLKIGQQVLVNKAEPYLPVMEIRKETYSQSIAYDTVYVDNANLYEGMTSTISAGKNGTMSITAEVSYVEGTEVARTVLSQSVVSQPVAAKVSRGTMKMLVASGYENARKSTNGFIWPVSGGYISQSYGRTPYEYWHTGIDYAYRGNGYGQPIVASLPGTVTYAGRRGSYGNLVVINHGNGIETWYAHCSSILVRVGDTVAQGDRIAKVGSTGNSSGNHLHFRVVVNGVEKNPLDYLP